MLVYYFSKKAKLFSISAGYSIPDSGVSGISLTQRELQRYSTEYMHCGCSETGKVQSVQ